MKLGRTTTTTLFVQHQRIFLLLLLSLTLGITKSSAILLISATLNHKMTKMKAVLASKFGPPDEVLTVEDAVMDKPEPDETSLLIQVHACSLSPGDYRALLGQKTVVSNPKEWPYVPGGDVCGTVQHVPKDLSDTFAVGDKVVATWSIWGTGGLAQYAAVDPVKTVKLPQGLSVEEGAALANSASHVLKILNKADIQPNERVLVLGGSGGLGTLMVQLLKKTKKVSYLAATSTDEPLMTKLGVDKTIDYTKENWWEVKEWQSTKFDCIIDLAAGIVAWNECLPVLKNCKEGGRFVAAVCQDWHIDGTSYSKVIFGVILPPLGRQLFNMFRWSTPVLSYVSGRGQSGYYDHHAGNGGEERIRYYSRS